MQTENTYVETDLGNIALNPRGEYSDETSYEYLDTVSYIGGSYMCLAELGKSISGIAPAQGENTQYWQMLTLPGQMTAEAVTMHDDVVNKAKQVETSRAAVELSQQEVEAAQADVSQMRQDTQDASQMAIASRDSAAEYAQSAETSRTAAKESEDNINAQVVGFDAHVTEKTSAAESAIEEARKTAIDVITTQQDTSTKAVADEASEQIKKIKDSLDKGLSEEGKAADAKATGDAINVLTEDLTFKADRTALVKTDRKLDALWKLNQGISYEFQTEDTEAYQKTIPSGAKLVSIERIGGKTIVWNAGELMSAPVNEVVQQGKNYFDFSKLVSDGVNVMDYDNQTITVPAKTNNTGYNQTLRDLCPGITPGTYVFSIKRSNPNSGDGSYFLEAGKDFPVDTPFELTDELLDNHIAWYNNPDSNIENVISEIQIEKNSAKTLYSKYYQKSYKIPQAILELDGYGESGNFVDFVEKKYHKGNKIIDISNIIGDTFQAPLEVEAGGTLTFKNSHGDDYRIPVPSTEEYLVSLAEVAK